MDVLTHSYSCGDTSSPLLFETIGQCFDRISSRHPEQQALVFSEQGLRWTYREYRRRVDELACGLLALGLQPGDRLGIMAPNCVEWCLTQFASAKIGLVLVCLNPGYRAGELEYALNKSGCRALIVAERYKSSDYPALLRQLAPELAHCAAGELQAQRLPALRWSICLGEQPQPGMLRFAELCGMGGDDERHRLLQLREQLQADDIINIQFTSGTTGSPKGACLSHFNILNNGAQVARSMALNERDRLCIPVPLYHCMGLVLGNLACLASAATAVIPAAGFDPLLTLQTLATERCTAMVGVPTMYIAALEHGDFSCFDLSAMRTGIMAGAPCPEPLMRRVIDDMNMTELLIMYGQTETSPVNHTTLPNDSIERRVATVGRCAPHQQIKIIDPQGRVVALGERGELCCRGYAVMRGYWQDPQQTAATIDTAGWLHSGDLATMDGDGYVRIVGRIKDMIIRGGENIYPREIEDFLIAHPAVQDVQVFGIPDEKYGEQVCVWLTLKDGLNLNTDQIRSYCKEHISHYKVPRYIAVVDQFPMTVTGKIQKFKMRELQLLENQTAEMTAG